MILLLCGSLFSCRHKSADPSVVRSYKYKKCLKEGYTKLGIFYNTNTVPGLTFAVSLNNEIVWADGIGYSNSELKVKASPSHKFRIGQVSELVTALTAAKLFEEGKLQIEKPVREYLPELNKDIADYTIHQLACHTSGIKPEEAFPTEKEIKMRSDLISIFLNEPLAYAPGDYFLHTELGYDLIGQIIEKNSNEALYKVVKKTVLDTLKMNSTLPDIYFRITENKSSTYDYDFIAQPIVASTIDLRAKDASTGYLSSVLDMIKMGNALLYPGFLKKETLDMVLKPYKLNSGMDSQYGFGMIVTKDLKGRTFYAQRGTIKGGCSILIIYPDDKLVVAMAGNINNNSWELPVFDIADLFLDQLHPENKTQAQADQPAAENQPAKEETKK